MDNSSLRIPAAFDAGDGEEQSPAQPPNESSIENSVAIRATILLGIIVERNLETAISNVRSMALDVMHSDRYEPESLDIEDVPNDLEEIEDFLARAKDILEDLQNNNDNSVNRAIVGDMESSFYRYLTTFGIIRHHVLAAALHLNIINELPVDEEDMQVGELSGAGPQNEPNVHDAPSGHNVLLGHNVPIGQGGFSLNDITDMLDTEQQGVHLNVELQEAMQLSMDDEQSSIRREISLDETTMITIEYTQEHIDKGQVECIFCVDNFKMMEHLPACPQCRKVFHEHCILRNFEERTTCPFCKCEFLKNDVPNENITNNDSISNNGANEADNIADIEENNMDTIIPIVTPTLSSLFASGVNALSALFRL